jgi:hypothetical protein
MPSFRKRPCCICHCWFLPDNRVGSRRRTCGRPECRQQRRRRMQAAWRVRNPDYFTARRLQARIAPEAPPSPPIQPGRSSPPAPSAPPAWSLPTTSSPPISSRPPAPLRLRAPLNQLPWDIAQSEFGPQGADFIGVMAGLLLHETQSEIAAYRVEITAITEKLRPPGAQSPIAPAAYLPGNGGEAAGHATGIPPT